MKDSLTRILSEYGQSGIYPCHMPGHKRNAFGDLPEDMARMDVTEVPGLDNLHDAEGILKEAQERAAKACGALETFFLVGGGSSGVLSAICSAVPEGGSLLIDRDAHKSAYHAMYLRRILPIYLYRKASPYPGICEALSPEEVRRGLEEYPEARAVFLVSPTYEGRIADISGIAEVVHKAGKLLIVDEAHGAHLPWMGGPAKSACSLGADLVIQSTHKTLPAPTQTALLHICTERAKALPVRRFLRIYQSSSPSYLLMAGIDNAIRGMEEQGEARCGELKKQFEELVTDLSECRNLQVIPDLSELREGIHDYGKLLIRAKTEGTLPGTAVAGFLRKEHRIETEMSSVTDCLAMFTVGDTPEGYERVRRAVRDLDERFPEYAESVKVREGEIRIPVLTEKRETFPEAWDGPCEEILLDGAAGKQAADFIVFYPPGSPVLVPGEVIGEEEIARIRKAYAQGIDVQGIRT